MSGTRDYSAGAVVGRLARAIGIVVIFSIAGITVASHPDVVARESTALRPPYFIVFPQ